MGKLIYKKSSKIVLQILQVVAAGILVYCLLNIGFWMEDNYSLREMAAVMKRQISISNRWTRSLKTRSMAKTTANCLRRMGSLIKKRRSISKATGQKAVLFRI